MIILNMGVPRSGTVLVNAIIRSALEAAGNRVLQANPHGKELPDLVRKIRASGDERYKTIVLHTHSWDATTARLLAASPFVVAFANVRDPRDVCVSLMRLHDIGFDAAVASTLASFRRIDVAVRDTDPMVIPYELLVAEKRSHIFHIARRLGLWLPLDTVARIDEATSIERHREVMEKVRTGTIGTIVTRRNTNRVLAEDSRTHITDRHIQSGRVGRWRDELEPAQQAEANARFGAMLRSLGYSLESGPAA